MRNRDCVKKCLALMLSVSMAVQPGCIALAEETEQASVQSTEVAVETPVTEASQTEAPATETPVTEASQTEAPVTEAPATEAPQTEAPATEAPATEAPETEAPETEAPETEAPATEAVQTEAPETEAPQTQEAETEGPAVQAETQYTVKYQIYTWNEAQKRNTKIVAKTLISQGAEATIPTPDASSIPDVTANGKKYVFKGWRVGRIGENNEIQTEVQFAPGTAVTTDVSELGNKYLMIYAVYAEQASSYTYTLNYDGNGADVTSVPEAQTDTNADGNAEFKVTDSKPVRAGYIFKGWAESADATEAKYAAGDPITITAEEANQSKTLYAVWESAMVGPQEDTEIKVYVEYVDSNLEDGYYVDEESLKTVNVTCQNKDEHSIYSSHQVKYNDVVKAADVSSFAVKEGWEIVGISRVEGANQAVFALDNTFMQGGVQSPYNDFYLVAKKKSTTVGPQENTEIKVYVEYVDSNLEDGYYVDEESLKTVNVTCQNKDEHSKYTSHQVKYNDVVKAADVSSFAVKEGWEIVGISRVEGANQAVFALDNTFMQGGVQSPYNDFYLVAKKKASSITLNKETLTLEFGAKETLTAELLNVEETAWTSSDDSVVTVAEDGTITAVGLGTAVVTCADKADENVKATCEVTVKDSTVLEATAYAISGTSARVKWNKVPSASGYKIYRMEAGGSYKAVKTVSAAATTWRNDGLTAGKTYRYYVQAYRMVEGKRVAIKKSSAVSCVTQKITLSASSLTLEYGKSSALKATLKGVEDVIWSSSNSDIVKADSNGNLTATGLGTVTITCASRKNKSVKATCKVTVRDTTLLQMKATAGKKSNLLSWNKIPSADGYRIYGGECGSTMKLIKTVSANTQSWNHSGLKAGKAYRYCVKAYRVVDGTKSIIKTSNTVHSITTSSKFTNVKSVTVSQKSITLQIGKTKKLGAKAVPVNAKLPILSHTAELVYTSSNSKVATVSKEGTVTAVGKGTCRIYVTAGSGASATVTVTVK